MSTCSIKGRLQKGVVTNMDKKALYNLTYGVFMLSTKVNDKENGCIINTCMQVANDPVRIAISVLNVNYTCEPCCHQRKSRRAT